MAKNPRAMVAAGCFGLHKKLAAIGADAKEILRTVRDESVKQLLNRMQILADDVFNLGEEAEGGTLEIEERGQKPRPMLDAIEAKARPTVEPYVSEPVHPDFIVPEPAAEPMSRLISDPMTFLRECAEARGGEVITAEAIAARKAGENGPPAKLWTSAEEVAESIWPETPEPGNDGWRSMLPGDLPLHDLTRAGLRDFPNIGVISDWLDGLDDTITMTPGTFGALGRDHREEIRAAIDALRYGHRDQPVPIEPTPAEPTKPTKPKRQSKAKGPSWDILHLDQDDEFDDCWIARIWADDSSEAWGLANGAFPSLNEMFIARKAKARYSQLVINAGGEQVVSTDWGMVRMATAEPIERTTPPELDPTIPGGGDGDAICPNPDDAIPGTQYPESTGVESEHSAAKAETISRTAPGHSYMVHLEDDGSGNPTFLHCFNAANLRTAIVEAPLLVEDQVAEGTPLVVTPNSSEPGEPWPYGTELRECLTCGERWPAADGVGCPKCVHGPAEVAKVEPAHVPLPGQTSFLGDEPPPTVAEIAAGSFPEPDPEHGFDLTPASKPKPARKPPMRTFRAHYRPEGWAGPGIDLGLVAAKNLDAAKRLVPDTFAGQEVRVGGEAVPIDPARVDLVRVAKTTTDRPRMLVNRPSWDVKLDGRMACRVRAESAEMAAAIAAGLYGPIAGAVWFAHTAMFGNDRAVEEAGGMARLRGTGVDAAFVIKPALPVGREEAELATA